MIAALIAEIALQKDYLGQESISTIYFGGGTPSLLDTKEIDQIIDQIGKFFHIESGAEVTLEANPDDLNTAKVNALKQTAVNRFSIGIQSFFDDDLIWMNRAHRANEAEASVKRAQDAGFENITVDLIFGYPLLTDAKWKHNMDTVFNLQIPHVSAYSMTVEPKTALAAFIKKKYYPPLNDQQSAEQFLQLADAMQQHGFEHYEISNYALPGHYSRHNTNYWRGVKYLGIGPSAHSFNGETRQWDIANNAAYMKEIGLGKVPAETEVLTETDRLNEYIMTSLRTMWGLDLEKLNVIAKGSSDDLLKEAEEPLEKGLIKLENNIITLTREGQLYADQVAADLFF